MSAGWTAAAERMASLWGPSDSARPFICCIQRAQAIISLLLLLLLLLLLPPGIGGGPPEGGTAGNWGKVALRMTRFLTFSPMFLSWIFDWPCRCLSLIISLGIFQVLIGFSWRTGIVWFMEGSFPCPSPVLVSVDGSEFPSRCFVKMDSSRRWMWRKLLGTERELIRFSCQQGIFPCLSIQGILFVVWKENWIEFLAPFRWLWISIESLSRCWWSRIGNFGQIELKFSWFGWHYGRIWVDFG